MTKEKFVKSLALGVATASLIVCTARAQEPSKTKVDQSGLPVAPAWVENFGKQLTASLDSDSPKIRELALRHIIYFASFYGDNIDFSDAVPTLVRLYREDDDADVRFYAVVALHAIGDERGMRQVRRSLHLQQWPPRLQFITIAALVSYYGPEYFKMDREAARLAEDLMKLYMRPQVEVGPLEVVGTENQQ